MGAHNSWYRLYRHLVWWVIIFSLGTFYSSNALEIDCAFVDKFRDLEVWNRSLLVSIVILLLLGSMFEKSLNNLRPAVKKWFGPKAYKCRNQNSAISFLFFFFFSVLPVHWSLKIAMCQCRQGKKTRRIPFCFLYTNLLGGSAVVTVFHFYEFWPHLFRSPRSPPSVPLFHPLQARQFNLCFPRVSFLSRISFFSVVKRVLEGGGKQGKRFSLNSPGS